MNPKIESIHIRGFRSLADVRISDMSNATVLIGANGSGKSNFIRFFEMMRWMLHFHRLNEYVQRQGGADDQLFGGNARTPRMEANIKIRTDYGINEYMFALSYAYPDRFIFTDERFRLTTGNVEESSHWESLGSGHTEANVVSTVYSNQTENVAQSSSVAIGGMFRQDCIFRFHDTSFSSAIKANHDISDNSTLRRDGDNLAAILYRLQRQDALRYNLICHQISRVLPGFERFELKDDYGKVLLRWRAKWTEKTIGAHLTSDGSLRFFALVTLLNLPPEMLPSIILLDEPELGLHPAAISLIGGMIKSLSTERQIILATQSPLLVESFELDEIIVLDLDDGHTVVSRYDPSDFQRWLNRSLTTGDLWRKNLLGGRP